MITGRFYNNLAIKYSLAILMCLLFGGCNQNPKTPFYLTDEEYESLWNEANQIAKTIHKEIGCTAMACDKLDPEGCVYVVFENKKATDADLERLGKMPRIGSLGLDGADITDAALVHLTNMDHLQYLCLSNTQISDAGLEHLKGLTQLGILTLRNSKVTEEGVKKLQQALPKCSIKWEPRKTDKP